MLVLGSIKTKMETPFFRIKKKQKYMTLTYTERLSMIIESYILYNIYYIIIRRRQR